MRIMRGSGLRDIKCVQWRSVVVFVIGDPTWDEYTDGIRLWDCLIQRDAFCDIPISRCLIIYVDAWSIIRDRWVGSINSILNHH